MRAEEFIGLCGLTDAKGKPLVDYNTGIKVLAGTQGVWEGGWDELKDAWGALVKASKLRPVLELLKDQPKGKPHLEALGLILPEHQIKGLKQVDDYYYLVAEGREDALIGTASDLQSSTKFVAVLLQVFRYTPPDFSRGWRKAIYPHLGAMVLEQVITMSQQTETWMYLNQYASHRGFQAFNPRIKDQLIQWHPRRQNPTICVYEGQWFVDCHDFSEWAEVCGKALKPGLKGRLGALGAKVEELTRYTVDGVRYNPMVWVLPAPKEASE